MRSDLRKPCKNCPFGTADTRIRFRTCERAEEIEEQAYRHGFPCHLSARDTSDEDEDGGYVFADDGKTQHCAGAIGMFINDCNHGWPGIDNDEELADRLAQQIDLDACFSSSEAFLKANEDR